VLRKDWAEAVGRDPLGALERALEHWDPELPNRAVHCANCANAVVSGEPDLPEVSCEMGWGAHEPRPLIFMVRPERPRGFRTARQCPDFRSMSD
jgi:hypothetical protein